MAVKKVRGGSGVVQSIIDAYRTEQRWEKAVQHLGDDCKLTGTPKDIGPLIGAVGKDVFEECANEIKEHLFKAQWKDIQKGLTEGLANWYIDRITKQ